MRVIDVGGLGPVYAFSFQPVLLKIAMKLLIGKSGYRIAGVPLGKKAQQCSP
jgi:hypothetical protein